MNRTEQLLIVLAEECAEVIQAISKALRFGLDDHAPGSEETNAERIAKELSDIIGVERMLINDGIIRANDTQEIYDKIKRVEKWLLYSKEKGRLTDENKDKVVIVCSGRQSGKTAELLAMLQEKHNAGIAITDEVFEKVMTEKLVIKPLPPLPEINIESAPNSKRSYQPWRDKKKFF